LVLVVSVSLASQAWLVRGGFLVDDWYLLARLTEPAEAGSFASNPWRFFFEPVHPRFDIYRPMVGVALSGDWLLYGTAAWGYLLTNLGLHLLGGGLFFRLALRLRPQASPWAVGAGALVFLNFPAQVEAVAWIAARSELLSWCFGVAGLLIVPRLRRRPTWLAALSLGLFALLSVWSKETGLVFGLMATLAIWWPRSEGEGAIASRARRLWAMRGLIIAAAACLLVRYQVFGALGTNYDGSGLGTLDLAEIARRLASSRHGFLPLPPDLLRPGSTERTLAFLAWVGLLIIAFRGALEALRAREFRWLALVLSLFFLPLLLAVMANPIEEDLRNSRALYASIGSCGLLIARGLEGRQRLPLLSALAAGLVASLMVSVLVGNRYVESGRAVERAVESLHAGLDKSAPSDAPAILLGVKAETYFGGLSSLVGSLAHATKPPFYRPAVALRSVMGTDPELAQGPHVAWSALDRDGLSAARIFVAARGLEATQVFRPLIPAVDTHADTVEDRGLFLLTPEAEAGFTPPPKAANIEVEFRFRGPEGLRDCTWHLVVIDRFGILVDDPLPPASLKQERGERGREWRAALKVPRAVMRRVLPQSRLAWTIYGERAGRRVTEVPPWRFLYYRP
jgi:hypothetical protein